MLDQLDSFISEHSELEARMSDPTIVSDQVKFVALTKRYADLTQIIKVGTRLRDRTQDIEDLAEMITDSSGAEAEELRAEQNAAKAEVETLTDEWRVLLLPKDPNDGKSVIIEIRGAEGGEEANLFARDLFEMYKTYASTQGWAFEFMGASESDHGGYTEASFSLKGDSVWTRMKFEAGPHRVQRVPTTESQGRIHTSSATVTVMPEAEEIELHIEDKELRYDKFRASGAGGQHVNKTESAIRLTHLPTGLVVSMQDEKSQLQNRERALKVMRSRLLALKQDEAQREASETRQSQTGGGGRSEKIRTYNFKENRLTDHRIGLTIYKLDKVLGGELDDVSDALVADERATQLAAQS